MYTIDHFGSVIEIGNFINIVTQKLDIYNFL